MRLPVALIALSLLAPATASASTATLFEYVGRGTYAWVNYDADPGEHNDLTVDLEVQGNENSLTLTDPGAEIRPGPGCEPDGAHRVTCTSSIDFDPTRIDLGDEADRLLVDGPRVEVDGGPGDDVLDGGDGRASTFVGGDGADTMIGTDDLDHFVGGPGADTMDGRGSPAGYTTGDTISYRDYTEPVTIDMSTPGSTAGAEGEGDTISNFEDAQGGAGDDTITATQEVWSPWGGSDVLAAGGNDVIQGGPGRDDLYGEEGDDTIRGAGGDDWVSGGLGADSIFGERGVNTMDDGADLGDFVHCGDRGVAFLAGAGVRRRGLIDQSCRRVDFYQGPIRKLRYVYIGQPTRAVQTTLVCHVRCHVRVALHAHRKLLGAATADLRRGHRAALTVPLGDEARAELAQAGELRVHFSMDARYGGPSGWRQRTSHNLLLHAAGGAR